VGALPQLSPAAGAQPKPIPEGLRGIKFALVHDEHVVTDDHRLVQAAVVTDRHLILGHGTRMPVGNGNRSAFAQPRGSKHGLPRNDHRDERCMTPCRSPQPHSRLTAAQGAPAMRRLIRRVSGMTRAQVSAMRWE